MDITQAIFPLIENGDLPGVRFDGKGKTALQHAEELGLKKVTAVLRAAGA